MKHPKLTWTPAVVGYYWNAPEGFHIATFASYRGGALTDAGYRLLRNREPLGEYHTLKAAQLAGERIHSEILAVPEVTA